MYAVTVTFQIKPDQMDAFLSLVTTNARASVENEPECHQFDVCSDPDRANEVFLYELYTNRAGFDAHRETDHFKTFDAATADMILDKKPAFYQTVDR